MMEVDPGSIAGTAVDRFLEEPLARGLNGETAVDRSLDTGVCINASAKKSKVSLPQTGAFFAGMKRPQSNKIPLIL